MPHTMTQEALYRLAPPLIALQFLAFGWTVNREINVAAADRPIVIPLPDVINIMSMFATVSCLIVSLIANESSFWLSRMVLGGAYVLIAFHPLTIAAHYRLWKQKDTSRKDIDGATSSYVNREELFASLLSSLLAIAVAAYLGTH
jgi:hypothetical protein